MIFTIELGSIAANVVFGNESSSSFWIIACSPSLGQRIVMTAAWARLLCSTCPPSTNPPGPYRLSLKRHRMGEALLLVRFNGPLL